jgi:hypothetical protein
MYRHWVYNLYYQFLNIDNTDYKPVDGGFWVANPSRAKCILLASDRLKSSGRRLKTSGLMDVQCKDSRLHGNPNTCPQQLQTLHEQSAYYCQAGIMPLMFGAGVFLFLFF